MLRDSLLFDLQIFLHIDFGSTVSSRFDCVTGLGLGVDYGLPQFSVICGHDTMHINIPCHSNKKQNERLKCVCVYGRASTWGILSIISLCDDRQRGCNGYKVASGPYIKFSYVHECACIILYKYIYIKNEKERKESSECRTNVTTTRY